MKSKLVWKWVVAGALIGYFIIHPVFMSVGHLMHQENIHTQYTLLNIILASFSLNMVPWALSFVFIFGFIGYLYARILLNEALLKTAKMGLEKKVEERTEELSHANQGLRAEIVQRKKAETELIERITLAELSAEIGAIP